MGTTVSAVKTIFIPAIIALLFFLFINFAIVPAWRFYRSRYGHYVPVDQISTQTLSLGYRMHVAVGTFFSKISNWRSRPSTPSNPGIGRRIRTFLGRRPSRDYSEMDDGLLSDAGEELDTIRAPGSEHYSGQPPAYDSQRLSRELEQGFMDDSEDEEDEHDGRRR